MAKNKKKFYGVKVGRVAGVYEAWDEAEAQVKGYDGALHKASPLGPPRRSTWRLPRRSGS